VKPVKLAFVALEPKDGQFRASFTMEGLLAVEDDPEMLLDNTVHIYEEAIQRMLALLAEMCTSRLLHKPIPARKMWQLGDAMFKLKEALALQSVQLDGIYAHLSRDLNVKRKWLEKAVIFRRHVPSEELIPESLNWGRCEKGTRRVAERLRVGLLPD